MKNIPILKTLLLAAGAALIAGQVEAATVLRMGNPLTQEHHASKILEQFKAEVEAATKGEVVIQIHYNGQPFKPQDMPMAVGGGSLEMAGIMPLNTLAPIYPELEVLDGPFMIDNRKLAERLYTRELVEPIASRLDKLGAHLLFAHPYGYFSFYGTNKRELGVPGDFAGLKIRAMEKLQIMKAKTIEAKPEQISGGEQYIAYQKGTVDIAQTGANSFVARKLYEIFKYGLAVRDNLMMGLTIINKKKWASLTPEQQQIITAASAKAAAASWDKMEQDENASVELLASKMTVHKTTSAEMEAWRKVFFPLNQTLLDTSGPSAKELYATIVKVRREEGMP